MTSHHRPRTSLLLTTALTLLLTACGSDDSSPGGTAGASAQGGSAGLGGQGGSAGTPAGGTNAAGGKSGSAGTPGPGGNAGQAGSGGAGAGSSGGAGAGTAGAAGAAGQAGGAGTAGAAGQAGGAGQAGVSGASGASGMSGTSGSSGAAGESGAAGVGGAAGVAGEGGAAGVAGSAAGGSAGDAGAGGNAGQAGPGGTAGAAGTSAGGGQAGAGQGGAGASQAGAGGAGAGGSPDPGTTIIDVAAADPDLSKFVALLQAAGLTDTLKGAGPFTLFAPTNASVDAYKQILDVLGTDPALLAEFLSFHVATTVSKAKPPTVGIQAQELISLTSLTSLFNPAPDTTFLDVAAVPDPVDPKKVKEINVGLAYPLPGSAPLVSINGKASNGVIHKVAGVFIAPKFLSYEADGINFSLGGGKSRALDLLTHAATLGFEVEAGLAKDFTIFTALATKCDLGSTLQSDQGFTIFAPLDSSFQAAGISASTSCATAKPLLRNHVTGTVVTLEGLEYLANLTGTTVTLGTLYASSSLEIGKDFQGNPVVFSTGGQTVRVVRRNLQTTNAIIHGIDGVLFP